jgi:hypothetical protein
VGPLGQTPGARPISTPSLSFLFSEQLARGTQSPSGLLLPREDSAARTNLTGSPGSALTLGLMEASSPFSRDKSWESATASTISAGELLQIERICFLLRAMTSADSARAYKNLFAATPSSIPCSFARAIWCIGGGLGIRCRASSSSRSHSAPSRLSEGCWKMNGGRPPHTRAPSHVDEHAGASLHRTALTTPSVELRRKVRQSVQTPPCSVASSAAASDLGREEEGRRILDRRRGHRGWGILGEFRSGRSGTIFGPVISR